MKERKATDNTLYRNKLRKIVRLKNARTPYARIGLAFVEENGVRLTWEEVEILMGDHAIAAAIYDIQENTADNGGRE